MRVADDGNTDVVTRVSKSTTMAARAGRLAEIYVSSAFQLAAETTDAGNVKYLSQTETSQKAYQSMMAAVLKDMPEMRAVIEPTIANFQKTFTACDPGIRYAATTTTPDENLKAAARLKAECVPLAKFAIQAHVKMVDELVAGATKISDDLTKEANSAIRNVWVRQMVCSPGPSALRIGIKRLLAPIGQLKTVMEAFARNDLKADVPGLERRDELGEMAQPWKCSRRTGWKSSA